MKNGLPPIVDNNTTILVLGSLPSDTSIKMQEYYSHPRNQFWELLEIVFNMNLVSKPYQEKISLLKKIGVGLWDVYQSGERVGSADAKIKKANLNDFGMLNKLAPNISLICFNGKKAFSHKDDVSLNIKKQYVPSSSPTHAIPFEEKASQWKRALIPNP